MVSKRSPNVDELEQQVRAHTTEEHRDLLAAVENLLNAYLAVIRESGPFHPTDENRKEQVWLLLTARSFNSMRWAYELVSTGYYTQAMVLTRCVFEDWLVCMDAVNHETTVSAILKAGVRLPSFSDMAQRSLPPELLAWWQGEGNNDQSVYGLLSTFAHPRYRSLASQLVRSTNTLRVGPAYEEDLFLVSFHYLATAARRMTEFLARSAGEGAVGAINTRLKAAAHDVNEATDAAIARARVLLGDES